MPSLSDGLWAAGLGLLGPAAFYAGLRAGLGPTLSGGCLAALALLWMAGPRTRGLAPAALAALLGGFVLLPAAGWRLTLAAGAALLLARAFASRPAVSREPGTGGFLGPLLLLLAAAAATAWLRALSALTGQSLLSFAGWLAAALAATALGGRLRPFFGLRPGLGLFAAGNAGLAGLAFLRFLGLNAGQAEHLQAPLLGAADALFLGVQGCLAASAWTAALPADAAGGRTPLRAAAAFAGSAAALAALPRFGPIAVAAAAHAAMALAGLCAAGPRRVLQSPALWRVLAGSLLACGLLGWQTRAALRDIWVNRLHAVYPGGGFLLWKEARDETIAAYRFSTGARVLLRDGGALYEPSEQARRAVSLAVLLHQAPRRVLLVGVRDPGAARAALSRGAEVDILEPAAPEVLAATDAGPWPPERLRVLARLEPEAAYDVIFAVPPGPPESPEASLSATVEAFARQRRRLAPGGLLALRVASPRGEAFALRALSAGGSVFAHSGSWSLPAGLLAVFSDAALPSDPVPPASRIPIDARLEDPGLEAWLRSLAWQDTRPGVRARTDDRAVGFLDALGK